VAILRRNLQDLHVGPQGIIESVDAWGPILVDVLGEHGCTLVLLDPPYQDLRDEHRRQKFELLLANLAMSDRWADQPHVLLHYPADTEIPPPTLGPWRVELSRRYGTSGILLLTPGDAA
jgi:16S rRNA G966 N2-methylase RsmD